ncbi:MAG: CopG family ribbon-helix-helix protein [Gammaproteobacteria bacterium]
MVETAEDSRTALVTVRVPVALRERLDALAHATKRSRSFLCAEALVEYLEMQAWQIEEIEKALREADAGDFATEEELQTLFRARAPTD